MSNLFGDLFSNHGFMPHIHCYLAQPGLVWTMATTDMMIGLAYVAISITLWVLIRRIKLRFNSIIICFIIFIAACGATHFMEVYNLWVPNYWQTAWIKILTAIASLGTGFYLFRLRHYLVKIAEAAKLSEQRRLDLETMTRTLEERVSQRTAELEATNNKLRQRDDSYQLVESAPDAFVIVNESGLIEVVNKQTENWFGYDRSELIGKPIEILLPEQFKGGHIKLRTNYTAQPKVRPMGEGLSLFGRRKDGSEFPVEISLSPITTPKGKLIASIIRDISARKSAEEKAKAVSDLLSLAIRSARIGTWSWNIGTDHIEWDQRMDQLFGVKAGEYPPTLEHFESTLHPDDLLGVQQALKNSVDLKIPYRIEYRTIWPDKTVHFISASGETSYNSDGSPLAMTGVCWDITEQKSAFMDLDHLKSDLERQVRLRTEELRKSETQLRVITDNIPALISYVDANECYQFVNAGYEKWFKKSKDQLIGQNLHDVIGDEAYKVLTPQIKKVLSGQLTTFEQEILYDADTTRYINANYVPDTNANGKTIGFFVLITDLSLLRQSEEALKKSEESYRLTIESIKDYAIYSIDKSGVVLSWNTGAEKIKGYKASEVIGKNFSIFYSQKDVEGNKPQHELDLAAAEGKYEDESPRFRKDGSAFWASVVISAIRDKNGDLIGFTKVVRDITSRKNDVLLLEEAKKMLEERVQAKTQDLIRSNAELEQFAYIASHDLQAPLRHIISYVQLLVAKVKNTTEIDPQTEKWIEYIVSGTRQMKSLITDLLTYSRVGRIDIDVEEVNVQTLIDNVIEALRESIYKTGAQIICDKIPTVFGVKSQLNQLFQNLIENAIKFKKPNLAPIVEIKCEDKDDFWQFTVSDNGIGIDPKYSERIFTMFQRLHTSDEYTGTGIGLAVCKKIVEFHGGKIGVESTEGKGSTFFFSLPKKEMIPTIDSSKMKNSTFAEDSNKFNLQ